MASVISLALSRSIDSGSIFITLAYSAGTAIPLLLIMVGGRRLLLRFSFLSRNTEKIQKGFGLLMVVSSLALFSGADRSFQRWLLKTFPGYGAGLTVIEDNDSVRAVLDARTGDAATFAVSDGKIDPLTLGSGLWINSPPLSLKGLEGKVVLVDFWTYSCVNCIRTLPYLRAWHAAYADAGLVIVGVHSPEFAFEKSETNLRTAIAELDVRWPVVQDNDFGIWNAYSNRYWPAHYLYDRGGKLVSTHFGEGAYEETEMLIRNLLAAPGEVRAELSKDLVAARVGGSVPIAVERSPETYLGYGRGQRFSSPEDTVLDRSSRYSLPAAPLEADHWAFSGTWTIEGERSISEASSSLQFRFKAAKVYLVINPMPGGAAEALVTLDGVPVSGGDVRDGLLRLDGDRLYTLLDLVKPTSGTIAVTFRGRAAVYAFTFG
jgi:thiol-disulfide isomerase/thioredoxin